MPRERSGDRREFVVLAGCLLASGLLFAFGRAGGRETLAGAQGALLWPADAVRGFVEGVIGERRENERLKQELARLRSERLRFLRAEAESERLRRALEFLEPRAPALRAARVLGVAGDPWPLRYRLTAGRDQGVEVGDPVIAPEGLVGIVESVGPRSCSAALLTDPGIAVAAEIVPGGARGVLRYRLDARPGLHLQYVSLTDTVRVGDEVATSGLSNRFPPGVPVGTVEAVERDPGGLVQSIRVRPSAPLTRLREVFVVVDAAGVTPWPEGEAP